MTPTSEIVQDVLYNTIISSFYVDGIAVNNDDIPVDDVILTTFT